jgi:myosin heavy subunit
MGVLHILEEECRFPKATDTTFLDKLVANHSKSQFFTIPKKTSNIFQITHYAGKVSYDIVGFLDKSRTTVESDFVELCNSSSDSLVSTLFKDEDDMLETVESPTKGKKAQRAASLGTQFKYQLDNLIAILTATEPSYVRCIKPNQEKRRYVFLQLVVIILVVTLLKKLWFWDS